MHRKLALLLVLPAALVLAAAPAQADPTCPEGNMCFWTGYNYTGARHLVGDGELAPPDTCAPIEPGSAAVFRSFKNRTRYGLIAPAWPLPSPGRECRYDKALRYGDDLPRIVPMANRPDYVRHYFRFRSGITD